MDFESFVLAASTDDLSDATDRRARTHADAVEFRLDLATDPLSSVSAYDGPLPLIVTNRPTWEGGGAQPGPERLEVLAEAATADIVEAVDVELESIKRGDTDGVLGHLHSNATVIVSVHDFDRTPPEEDCRELLEAALDHGDIAKLAVTAEDPADVLGLLSATRTYAARGQSVATMAMGEAGRHSRAIAPLYGSKIGYAPVRPADATAPGQYDIETLRSLIEELRGP